MRRQGRTAAAALVCLLPWAGGGGVPAAAGSSAPGAVSPPQEVEEILSYDVDIEIRPGGSMAVTEVIVVRALGREIRRGIFRDFPTSFPRASGLGRIEAPFTVTGVSRDDEPEPYTVRAIGGPLGRGGVRVRIGDPDALLDRGVHRYTIRYDTNRWVRFGTESDQLYWNVTGTGWSFPIRSATARVRGEELTREPALEAWTGPEGLTSQGIGVESAWNPAARVATFGTTESLGPREGLTIRVTVPAGTWTPPSDEQRAEWFALDWGGWVEAGYLVLLVIAVYLLMWRRVGMDPAPSPTSPRRDPPEGFSPAALGFLEERGYEMRHLPRRSSAWP